MLLYHGTNIEIAHINLDKSKPYKDFGRGFYATKLLSQAKQLAKKNALRYGNVPIVNVYEFDEESLKNKNYAVKIFDQPNEEWARFIIANRNPQLNHPIHKYDIVIGPVANDDISVLFRTYMTGIIDLETLNKALAYKKLTNQYFFHTKKSLQLLRKKVSR